MEFHRSSFHVATSLFIFITLIQMMSYSLASTSIPTTKDPNIDYIENLCNTTLYPHLCYKSLSTFSSRIHKSPRLLAQTALAFALSNARSTSTKMKTLVKTRGLKPRENAAMVDCLEELSDAVYELTISLEEMGRIGPHHRPGSNFELFMSDIQTWVSAALTDDDTCMDGFSDNNMNGDVKIAVRGLVLKVAQLASVSLAFVNNYALMS